MPTVPTISTSRRRFGAWMLGVLFTVLTAVAGAAPKREADLSRFFQGRRGAFVMLDVRNGTYTRYNPERCRQRFAPCSTFKIPNSLIGLETGVIPNPDYLMKWDGTKHYIPASNRDHTLRTAFRDSVIWYYRKLAARVGTERMRHYVKAFGYGNQEVPDAGEGFWLDRLKISPDEQVAFLHRLYRNDLPLSRRTMDHVREVMLAARTKRGILRGKTGTQGYARGDDMVATMGWYVGWVEHGGSAHIFATNITGGPSPMGRDARRITEAILKSRGLL